jgi:hypothetical protein
MSNTFTNKKGAPDEGRPFTFWVLDGVLDALGANLAARPVHTKKRPV